MGSLFGETFGAILLLFSSMVVKFKSSSQDLTREAFYAGCVFILFLVTFSLILNILLPFTGVVNSFLYGSFLVFEIIVILIPGYFVYTTPSLKYFLSKLIFSVKPKFFVSNKVDVI